MTTADGKQFAGQSSVRFPQNSHNLLRVLAQDKEGHFCNKRLKVKLPSVSSYFNKWIVKCYFEHIFNKLISSLIWHPRHHNVVLVGSRGGDIAMAKVSSSSVQLIKRGRGRGATVTDIKFDGFDNNWFYYASCGRIIKQRLDVTEEIILKDSSEENNQHYDARFGCLDVNIQHRIAISGDNNGVLHLVKACEDDNTSLQTVQVHLSNILHCEFNKFNDNLFVTCSIDGRAKIWDLRMFSNYKVNPIIILMHDSPLNCASFSSSGGETLLINDYYDKIQTYLGPDWRLQDTIQHPHNQYHRFGLIKAKFHPTLNVVLIANSTSDINEVQPVDFIDLNRRKVVASLTDGKLGVMPINSFNCTGDLIASVRGQNLVVFQSKD